MFVKVQKVNSGVVFSVVKKRLDTKRLLQKAMEMYQQQVLKIMETHDFPSHVGATFIQAFDHPQFGQMGAVVQLEPWGFAGGTFEQPTMVGGSTATPQRARLLLAYQAPLERTKNADGSYSWHRDFEVK